MKKLQPAGWPFREAGDLVERKSLSAPKGPRTTCTIDHVTYDGQVHVPLHRINSTASPARWAIVDIQRSDTYVRDDFTWSNH